MLAGWGFLALIIDPKAKSRAFSFAGTLVTFSILAIIPDFIFFRTYFVLVLPAISLLIGLGLSSMGRLLANAGQSAANLIPVPSFCLPSASQFIHQRLFLFRVDPVMASRLTYGTNPFPESLKIAQYLKEHTSSEDSIAVLGSEPQIYFYAHRTRPPDTSICIP